MENSLDFKLTYFYGLLRQLYRIRDERHSDWHTHTDFCDSSRIKSEKKTLSLNTHNANAFLSFEARLLAGSYINPAMNPEVSGADALQAKPASASQSV